MCETIQSENQEKQQSSWCKGCPLQSYCIIDTDIKNSTDNAFVIIDTQIETWATENPEPVYPTWIEWLMEIGVIPKISYGLATVHDPETKEVTEARIDINPSALQPIPADIAEKLGIEPKENK